MTLRQFEPLNDTIRDLQFSGVIRIKKGSTTVFDSASGYASKSYRVPNTMKTRFANASVTKMFTAVAFLALVEKGLLSLDQSVTEYLDLVDSELKAEITPWHLLTHTSGIAEYFDNLDPNGFENLWLQLPNQYIDNLAKMLPLFIDEPPIGAPGQQFDYCGSGFILLGLMVEKAMGIDYYHAIRRLVFEPAFMMESDFIPLQNVVDHIAEGYIPLKDETNRIVGWTRNIYAVPTYGLSDGGAFCTARDLIKFMKALREGQLLSAEGFVQMATAHVAVSENYSYGFGLWLEFKDGNLYKYGHTGEDPGVSARVYYYPKYDLDVVVLGNHSFSTSAILSEIEKCLNNNTL